MDGYDSFLIAYESMSEDDRKQYWKEENAKDNRHYLASMHQNITVNRNIIDNTKRWLERCVLQYKEDLIDEAKLREHLLLGAELIQGCEDDTGRTMAEIAVATRYPLYSQKRRQWYQTKEGKQWATKNLPKTN